MMSMIKMETSAGTVLIELYDDKAPKTVANFLSYVESAHYDGTIFHRIIDGFMVQGGGFEPGLKQKPTQDPIENEANNGLLNEPYTLAMARTSDPHSASAQFFINVSNNHFLNYSAQSVAGWGYCVFGCVVEGMDVIDKIRQVPTGSQGGFQDVPKEDVVIVRCTVVDATKSVV